LVVLPKSKKDEDKKKWKNYCEALQTSPTRTGEPKKRFAVRKVKSVSSEARRLGPSSEGNVQGKKKKKKENFGGIGSVARDS